MIAEWLWRDLRDRDSLFVPQPGQNQLKTAMPPHADPSLKPRTSEALSERFFAFTGDGDLLGQYHRLYEHEYHVTLASDSKTQPTLDQSAGVIEVTMAPELP